MPGCGGGQWSLYWTAHSQPVPCWLVPVLAGLGGLDERERAAGIEPGHPILIDPEFRIDPVLARFLARSRFTWLAEGTRGRTPRTTGCSSPSCGSEGSTGTRRTRTTCWTGKRGGAAASRGGGSAAASGSGSWPPCGCCMSGPRRKATSRAARCWCTRSGWRDGSTVMAADQAPRDVRCSDVKWVTPRTYRLWLEVGLLGYDTSGQPDRSWRGRNDGRNAAFTDLLFSSGLRLREGGCLLTVEVPEAAAGHGVLRGQRRGRGGQAARAHVLRLGRRTAARRRVYGHHPGRGDPPRPAASPLRADAGEADRHQDRPRRPPEAVLAR